MSLWNFQPQPTAKVVRRTFFSFHYAPDNQRAQVVKQSWLTKSDRQAAGFFDSSAMETKKRTSHEALKAFLTEQLKGTSVTCVLIGTDTAFRPWVRYEIVRSFQRGNGLFGIRVHNIKNFQQLYSAAGENPFEHLAYRVQNNRVTWLEKKGGAWASYGEVPSIALADVAYTLGGKHYHTFSSLFPIYDWVFNAGYSNLGTWVDQAARQAGK